MGVRFQLNSTATSGAAAQKLETISGMIIHQSQLKLQEETVANEKQFLKAV